MYVFSCHLIYAVVEVCDVFLPAVVQEALAEIEGKLLMIVAGNGYLTFQLAFGIAQLGSTERFLHDFVEFTTNQTQTFLYVMRITTEIDAPHTCVAIVYHRAFNGVDQSITFSEREVQTGIHARSAQNVVQQIERYAKRVVDIVGLCAQHHMGLVRADLAGVNQGDRSLDALGTSDHGPVPLIHRNNRMIRILQYLAETLEVDITIDKKDGIVRTIVASHEA